MGNYKFESEYPSFGSEEDVNNDLEEFIKRLQIDSTTPGKLDQKDEELLRTYVKANHRAADWYSRARDRRRESRVKYAKGRIILLALLPVGVFVLSLMFGGKAAVAQATVILTGLIAAFRASSEWMEKKFAGSNFAKAASDLKEKIYAFEGEWKGKAFTANALMGTCRDALTGGIKEAREIARKQREAYFAATAPPSIDIMKSLDKAKTDVAALIKNYQAPELKKALKDEQEKEAVELAMNLILAKISKLTALIDARDQLIAEKKQEMEAEQDEARKGALKTFIDTLKKAQLQSETELMKKTLELAAM